MNNLSAITPFIIPIIAGSFGIFVGILLEKFKSRVVFLRRRVKYFHMGSSAHNHYWGKIDVQHNGREAKHLSFITIEIENNSSKNFTQMIVDVWVEKDNQILGFYGNYLDGGSAIAYEKEYRNSLHEVAERNAKELAANDNDPNYIMSPGLLQDVLWVRTNNRLYLPVLNKGNTVILNFLVENFYGNMPVIHSNITHEGVTVIDQEDQDTKNRKLSKNVIGYGLLLYAVGLFFLLRHYETSRTPLIWIAILGLLYYPLGWFIYSLVKMINRLLR